MNFKDLTGQTFDYLTVIERAENHYTSGGHSKVMWKCQCKCGAVKIVHSVDLLHGHTKSCGCWNLEKAKFPKEHLREMNDYDLDTYEYAVGYDKNGNSFIFDKDDYELVSQFCWHKHRNYFEAKDIRNNCDKSIFLHKLIMNCEREGRTIMVDHINGNPDDCRKSNLRIATATENNRNRVGFGKSKVCGITWHSRDKLWEVSISLNGERKYIGRSKDYSEAVRMRVEAEEKYYGEYGYFKSRNIDIKQLIKDHEQMEVV